MADRDEIVDTIAGYALFADLTTPQLQAVAHIFEERWYPDGERVLRQGLSGSGFYVVIDGACSIQVDGQERARLSRGDFFGEVSILLGEPPVADVVAIGPLRCLVLAGPAVEGFLVAHPRVMYRMLQASARRLRNANRWRS
jgi:CRP-like cAMP-binding protein